MADIDLARVKRNVAKMAAQGAPEADIDGYIASEGTSVDAVRAFKATPAEPPPGYGGADVDRSDPRPLWDIPGDIGRAATASTDALRRDFTNAFFNRPAPERKGLWNRLKEQPGEFVDSMGRMVSAAKLPLDAMGVVMSPITGALKGTVGSALSYVPGASKEKADAFVDQAMMAIPAGRTVGAAKPVAPTIAELKQAGDAGYKAARAMNAEIKPQSTAALSDDIAASLARDGHRDYLSPKTFRAIEELKTPAAGNATISDIEGVRRILSEAGKDHGERGAAGLARRKLDDYLENLPKSDVVAGDPQAAARTIREARGNIAASKRAERVEKAVSDADLNASAANSGANLDNATRQALKAILKDPKKVAGYSPEEIEQLRQAVTGTFTGNTARMLGNILGGGGGVGGMGIGLGTAAYTGNPLLGLIAPVTGMGAKRLGAASTSRQAAKLDEMLRARSPLGRSRQQAGAVTLRTDPRVGMGLLGQAGGEVGQANAPDDLIRFLLQDAYAP